MENADLKIDDVVDLNTDEISVSPGIRENKVTESFILSIKQTEGNITPVSVFLDDAGNIVLNDGLQRLSACKELGLPVRVRVVEKPGNERSRITSQLHSNISVAMSASDHKRAIKQALKAGMSREEITETLPYSDTYINGLFRLTELPDRVVEKTTTQNCIVLSENMRVLQELSDEELKRIYKTAEESSAEELKKELESLRKEIQKEKRDERKEYTLQDFEKDVKAGKFEPERKIDKGALEKAYTRAINKDDSKAIEIIESFYYASQKEKERMEIEKENARKRAEKNSSK